jgi:hypothetical protein
VSAASISPLRLRAVAHVRRALAAGLVPLTIAGAGAGCGSSSTTGTSADPAGVVPASAPLYAGAIVRPEGALKGAAQSAGRALTSQADPYLHLVELLQTPGSPPIDFNRDLAPWLGTQAGVFASSLAYQSEIGQLLARLARGLLGGGSSAAGTFPFGAHGVHGAIVLDTRDAARARSFLGSQAGRAGAHAADYRGVAYEVTSGGIAFGVVDRFAVIGSESGMHSVIETTQGATSLARAPGYAKLLSFAPSGALAHVYANPNPSGSVKTSAGSVRTTAGSGGPSASNEPQGLHSLLRLLAGTREVNVSLVPSTTSIALDADALASGSAGAPGGLVSSSAEGTRALGELPGESWLAVGLGDVSATLGEDVQGLRSLASLGTTLVGRSGESSSTSTPELNIKGVLNAFLAPLSVLGANSAEARRDFQSWFGSAGIFASGSGLLELKGAVVIASKNPTLSQAAVGKLANQLRKAGGSVAAVSVPGTDASVSVRLPGLPIALYIANGRDSNGQTKFVIGLGEASVAAALNPPSKLSSAPSYAAAASVLGEGIQPSLMVDFPTLLSLLEGIGLAEDPTISKLVPYLRTLTTLDGGGKSLGGGVERLRLVLGLRAAG